MRLTPHSERRWTRWSPTFTSLHPQSLFQPEPVSHRKAFPVVVEIRIDVGPPAPALDPHRPLLQLALGVVAAAPARAVVEAHERPVGRQLVALEVLHLGTIADDERGPVTAQQLVHLVREPAGMAELERVTASRERLQRAREALVVAVEVGRQLPQHGAELRRADERL